MSEEDSALDFLTVVRLFGETDGLARKVAVSRLSADWTTRRSTSPASTATEVEWPAHNAGWIDFTGSRETVALVQTG